MPRLISGLALSFAALLCTGAGRRPTLGQVLRCETDPGFMELLEKRFRGDIEITDSDLKHETAQSFDAKPRRPINIFGGRVSTIAGAEGETTNWYIRLRGDYKTVVESALAQVPTPKRLIKVDWSDDAGGYHYNQAVVYRRRGLYRYLEFARAEPGVVAMTCSEEGSLPPGVRLTPTHHHSLAPGSVPPA